MAVLFGLFLFPGFATLGGNQFTDRVTLCFTDRNLYPEAHHVKRVPKQAIHKSMAIRAVSLGALWVLKTSAAGILVPVLMALLVALRIGVNRVFDAEHLEFLDSEEEDPNDMEMDVHAWRCGSAAEGALMDLPLQG